MLARRTHARTVCFARRLSDGVRHTIAVAATVPSSCFVLGVESGRSLLPAPSVRCKSEWDKTEGDAGFERSLIE
jgi:hypothetical protein